MSTLYNKVKNLESIIWALTKKTAISTGAASGMGLLFAQNFASLGGNFVLCDVNDKVLEQKVAEINEKGQFINGENIMRKKRYGQVGLK